MESIGDHYQSNLSILLIQAVVSSILKTKISRLLSINSHCRLQGNEMAWNSKHHCELDRLTLTDRHNYFKSGNIPETECGQIHLSFVTVI